MVTFQLESQRHMCPKSASQVVSFKWCTYSTEFIVRGSALLNLKHMYQ